jgi:ribosomal protein S18 acetylase RimI-like enzyme
MNEPVSEIVYPRQFDTVCIERLAEPDKVQDAHAYAALVLLEQAYANLFEKPVNGLEKGTFTAIFDSGSDAKIAEQKTRMQTYIENGSVYYFVDDDDIPEFSLTALAKTTPSRSSGKQEVPNCYVNDLVVHPECQNQGFSRMLLHSITKFGGFDPARYLALDAFTSNRVINDWFERLGFREISTNKPLVLKLGGVELQQKRYSTEPQVTIADVVTRLETNDSILRLAQPRNA